MSEVQVFENKEFGRIRITEKEGRLLFIAKDLCECLGITNHRDAVMRLDDDEREVGKADTHGGTQGMLMVSESGAYNLIMRSNKPEARRFRKWVTADVLPTIRKTGVYATNEFIEKTLNDPEWAIQVLSELKKEREGRMLAEKERDEAIMRKGEISSQREAKAMALVSKKTRECNDLRKSLEVVNKWSSTNNPVIMVDCHPGEIIREYMDLRGWSRGDLAKKLGVSVQSAYLLIQHRRKINKKYAEKLVMVFGYTVEYWLGLEKAWEEIERGGKE